MLRIEGKISLKESSVGMYGIRVLVTAVRDSTSLRVSYSRMTAVAMDLSLVYATSMPAMRRISAGSLSSSMIFLDICNCARWAFSTEKVGILRGVAVSFLLLILCFMFCSF